MPGPVCSFPGAALFGILLALAPTARAAPAPQATAWPTREWQVGTPESVGLDSVRLKQTLDLVGTYHWRVDSLQVVRHGRLILDAYFYPYAPGHRHSLRSVTKSVTSSLLGLSIAQGKWPGVEVTVLSQFPGRNIQALDARKRAMTLGDLVDMRSGLDWTEWPYTGTSTSMHEDPADPIGFDLDLPMADPPGAWFNYCSANSNLLAAMLAAVWHQPVGDVAGSWLFQPLGITRFSWPLEPDGRTLGSTSLALEPLDMARLGLLWLHDGLWNGRRVLPEGWTGQLFADALPLMGGRGYYKRGFWMDSKRTHFYASGRHGQTIWVDPALDLVLVLTGKTSDARSLPNDTLIQHLLDCVGAGDRLPDNPGAQSELKAALQRIARPPRADPPPAGWAVPLAGTTWRFPANPLAVESLRFLPDPEDAGAEILEIGLPQGRSVRYACGMDGAYRFRPETNPDHSVSVRAWKGAWVGAGVLDLESQDLDSAMYTNYRLQFTGHDLTVAFADNEYFSGTLHAVCGPDEALAKN